NVNINDSLSAVTATSASDVWAVGFGFSAGIIKSVHGLPAIGRLAIGRLAIGRLAIGRADRRTGLAAPEASPPAAIPPFETFILHWDGRTWTRVPSPNPGSGGLLFAVDAMSPANALAVGEEAQPDQLTTLALHWDGKAWIRVATSNPGSSGEDELNGVTFTSPGTAWAAGDSGSIGGFDGRSVIEEWNGTRFRAVRAPVSGISSLSAIGSSSPSDIWAVGSTRKSDGGDFALAVHCC